MSTLDQIAASKPVTGDDESAATIRPIRVRLVRTMTGFGLLAVVTCLLAPLVGSAPISLARVFDRSIPFSDNVDAQIFFVARMPRVFAGALVGAALATAGVVFQALLRNPLATRSQFLPSGSILYIAPAGAGTPRMKPTP